MVNGLVSSVNAFFVPPNGRVFLFGLAVLNLQIIAAMARRILKANLKLLKASFNHQEWEFLKRNPKFKAQIKSANDTLDDFESLARLGNDLVSEWEIETRLIPSFQKANKVNAKI